MGSQAQTLASQAETIAYFAQRFANGSNPSVKKETSVLGIRSKDENNNSIDTKLTIDPKLATNLEKSYTYDSSYDDILSKQVSKQSFKSDGSPIKKENGEVESKTNGSSARPWPCNQCNYAATQRGSLKIHILAIHAKAKPYKCLSCEYSATTKGAMNQHVTGVHSGIKPFACHQCSYASSFKHNLKTHINLKHPEAAEAEVKSEVKDEPNANEDENNVNNGDAFTDFINMEDTYFSPADLLEEEEEQEDDDESIL